VNFGPLFRGAQFSTADILDTFVIARRKLAWLGIWAVDTYFPNFVNFGPGSRDTMRRLASVVQ